MAKVKVVSFSELDALRQCPLKHYLAYEERWVMPGTSPALERGKIFHTALERYYVCLTDPRVAQVGNRFEIGKAVALESVRRSEADDEMRELLTWMLDGYWELYGNDGAWEVVAVEMPIEVPLLNEKGNRTSYRIKGKIDLLVRDLKTGGGLWIVDHKTCSTLPKEKDYDYDDQTAIYTRALRRQGVDVRGAIFNACRTKKLKRDMVLDERFVRVRTTRTDAEMETMEREVYETFAGRIRRTPSTGQTGVLPPRSPDPERCSWRCGFKEPCLISRKGGDIKEFITAIGGVQDPTRH